LSERLDKRRP